MKADHPRKHTTSSHPSGRSQEEDGLTNPATTTGPADGDQAERDAAEQQEIASYMVQAMLRRIDIATESASQEVDSSQDGGSDGGTDQLYPSVNDRARTRTVGRAH